MSSKKNTKKFTGFSDEERAAMKERAEELLTDKKGGEAALLAKVSEMKGLDQTIAKKIHEIVKENAPGLSPKTWYGMPAYANKEGKVVCFFQSAGKFKARYATLGFNDTANLDEGVMWPTTFAIKKLSSEEEVRIAKLVKKAVS